MGEIELLYPAQFSNSTVVAALELMCNSCQPISVEDIADHVHLSPSRFKHLFKEVTGVAPGHALRRIQVEKASGMLRDSNEQVKWIAAESGMPVSATFERNFHTYRGCSPSEYRRASERARSAGA